MKTIKITLLSSILLVVLALSFAFVPVLRKSSGESPIVSKTPIKNKNFVTPQWWVFTGAVSTMSAAINPNNYRPLEPWESVITLCRGSERLCAIFADPDPSNPSKPLVSYGTNIWDALNMYFWFGSADPIMIKLKNP